MKKILIGLLVVISLFCMSACGKSEEVSKTSSTEATDSEPIYSQIVWPTSDIAKLLPVPKSSVGKIEWEHSYGFVAYIAETSQSDYDEYVKLCEDAGFTVDYSKGDDYFWADNADGYHVSLKYEGDDVMFIRIDEPKENTDSPTEPPANEGVSSGDDASTVTPEFKELMDNYEAFFDEYVAFMKKYNDSTDQAAMMADMSDYMSKYSDMMSKLEAVDDSELSAADSAYYLEVSGRIMKKLAEIA